MKRRDFLRTAGGTAAVAGGTAAATTPAAAQSKPSFGGWLDGTSNYDGVHDMTGKSEVTVTVGAEGNQGNFAFGPAAIQIDPGTKVVWEWNGKGGGHNVHAMEGASFTSETVSEAGHTFSHTFESEGVVKYQCDPHASLGMKGVVVTGALPGGGGGGGGGGGTEEVVVGPGGSLTFEPEKLEITPGTTVNFVWDSDGHNIVVGSQPEGANWEGTPGGKSELYDTGYEYSFTFEVEGKYHYWCEPHKSAGMVGDIVVSKQAAAKQKAGGGEKELHDFGVPLQAHWVGSATMLMVFVSLVFTFYVLKYGESPNTGNTGGGED